MSSLARSLLRVVVSTALPLAIALPTHAADRYPDKPVRMVVCCVGAIAAVARTLAEEMSKDLGQPVVVDSRPGAAGGVAADLVAKTRGDGYTILIGTNATHGANQSLYRQLPYDYVKDFQPIGGIAAGAMVLLAPVDSPIRTVEELTRSARGAPGKLNYAWAGTSPRIAMALYNQLTDIRMTDIPYKTNPQATTDLIGGQFDAMFADMNTSAPLIKAGRLRGLAVTGPRRASVLPDVPTMQEAGVPGYSLTWWFAAWAPAGTPQPIVDQLSASLAKAVKSPRLAENFEATGAEPMPMTPDELMKFQIAEHGKWAEIIRRAGIEPQ